MGDGLFPDDAEFVRIPMPDADVVLKRRFELGASPDDVFARLVAGTAWREENVTMWGKTMLQPRLVAWYGDEGASYVYSGTRHDPLPWTPLLLDLRERVEAATATRFNSVLANLYRNERDSVAMHSDDERELGREPVIASLSLGETRTLVFRHRTDKALRSWKLPLESGSMLLMKGSTQRCWQHGVPKESRPCGPRVNLTFRRVLRAAATESPRTRGNA